MKKNVNLLKIAEQRAKTGNPFLCGGIAYKICVALFITVSVYSLMMCLGEIIGNIVLMSEYADPKNVTEASYYNEQRTYLITMCLSVAAIIASAVLLKFRAAIPLAALGSVNCAVVFTVLYSASAGNDIKNGGTGSFWLPFGIPSILCAVLAVYIGVSIFIHKARVTRIYDEISYNLYNANSDNGEKNLSAGEFERILTEYDGKELFRTDIPLKKSVRRRKDKSE